MNKDLVIYGMGKVGQALKILADKTKNETLYFNSEVYTVDTDANKAQFTSANEIKDIPNSIIHIIAIDTGIVLNSDTENGFIPDTIRIKNLIEEIILERGDEEGKNINGDSIVIESTVEIGFFDSLLAEDGNIHPTWEIYYSPERYLEDATQKDGFSMDKVKLLGVTIEKGSEEDQKEAYAHAHDELSNYTDIFVANDINVAVAPLKEVEAAKVIENTIRYLNLAFVNELNYSLSNKVDLGMVLQLVGNKEGYGYFANQKPGLIGGGCIPIDPLYLPNLDKSIIASVVKGEQNRFNELISSTLKIIIGSKIKRVGFMGITYKPNSTSTKNSLYLKAANKIIGQVNQLDVQEAGGKIENNENYNPTKFFMIDHLAEEISTPDKYFEDESLSALELIIVGANHKYKDTDYKALAVKSGTNVLDLNTLSIYRKNEE